MSSSGRIRARRRVTNRAGFRSARCAPLLSQTARQGTRAPFSCRKRSTTVLAVKGHFVQALDRSARLRKGPYSEKGALRLLGPRMMG